MQKKNKGAVLTTVILMVLIMTLIGVPLLGLVVYNYQLREFDNSIKRAEYENEMAMDKVSILIRKTVVSAIEDGVKGASNVVDEISEAQRNSQKNLYNTYEAEWNSLYNDYKNSGTNNEAKQFIVAAGEDETAAKENYIREKVTRELAIIAEDILNSSTLPEGYATGSVINDLMPEDYTTGSVIDEITGQPEEDRLYAAYNAIFAAQYRAYISEKVGENVKVKSEYANIVNTENDVFFEKVTDSEIKYYLTVELKEADITESGNQINIPVSTMFKKNAQTPPTMISATFVIGTPDFNMVSSVETQTVTLSNPLLNGIMVVGGKLTVGDGTNFTYNGDVTVKGNGVVPDASGKEVSVLLKPGAEMLAEVKLESGKTVYRSKLATPKDILAKAGSSFSSGSNPVYYRNFYIGEKGETGETGINVNFNGDVVAKDDLEINFEGTTNIEQTSGNYYGYNDSNDEGPDSSSAIVFNSKNISNKTVSLANLYLAGRAFIEGVTNTTETGIYKTGESIAVKGNYIAYQTPIMGTESDFRGDKVKFSTYFIKSEGSDRERSALGLADYIISDLTTKTETEARSNFELQKWRYFKEYANENGTRITKPNISGTIKYLEGTGFNGGAVTDSVKGLGEQASFRDTMAEDYEKHTKYFGYMPEDESKRKTDIFGESGWIKSISNPINSGTPSSGTLMIKTVSGDYGTLTLGNDSSTLGLIICTGDITINVTGEAIFNGMIIAGGNVNITGGGTLTMNDAKDTVISAIIENHLKDDLLGSGSTDDLFEVFSYDESGTTYVVTNIGENYININDLINITNWKKRNFGRL